MKFEIEQAIEILERTPETLSALLSGISNPWLHNNEGQDTWSPYQIVGHLIHGEKTDWIIRAKIILSDRESKTFEPFDRFAQERENQDLSMDQLLSDFKRLRIQNLKALRNLEIDETKLQAKGNHPELGAVNLKELLAAWVAHDLGHIAQISRVMAKQYHSEVGVWEAYLGILNQRGSSK